MFRSLLLIFVAVLLAAVSSCASSSSGALSEQGATMQGDLQSIGQRNKDAATSFFRLLEEEKIEAMVALFAEDGRQTNPYASGIFPTGADGREALLAYWGPVPQNFDGMQFRISEIQAMENPNTVFVQYRGELRLPNGAGIYANDYFSVFRFNEGGKIVEHVEIFNPLVAGRAFGLLKKEKPVSTGNDAPAQALSNYFKAVDQRQWDKVIDSMTVPVHIDYSSFGAGDPVDAQPQDIVAGWQAFLPGFDRTHHQLDNLKIDIQGNQATASCDLVAVHTIGDEVWVVEGSYEIKMIQTANSWRLSSLRFLFQKQSGNTDLPAEATRRAKR